MNLTPLQKITYGLYVVGCYSDDRPGRVYHQHLFSGDKRKSGSGDIAQQNNFTLDAIRRNPRFSLSILAEDTDPSIIGKFGFARAATTTNIPDTDIRILTAR